MKRILLLCLFVVFLYPAFGQQRTSTLRGTVVDQATGQPLMGAMIQVDSLRRTVSDRQGNFSLSVPRGQSQVEISFLGYLTDVRKIDFTLPVVSLGTVRLSEEGFTLDQVVVQGQASIAIQKGDTTQFSAAAFKTNPDASAGDLINKLPGASVEGGSVTIQGETVQRAYVDGKLFFGDDVMAAMQNIPSDAIESIQMFDEMSDEAKFAGFDDGTRRRALNIVTRHKVNRSTTGRIETGYGMELDKNPDGNYQDRYIVSGNVNTFNDKHRWSLNGTANNMNRANRGDGFEGGMGGGMRGGGLRTINSVGLNYSGNWNPKLQVNGSYTFNQNKTMTDSWSIQDYFDGNRYVFRNSDGNSTRNTHRFNSRVEYEGARDRLLFRLEGSWAEDDSFSETLTKTWLGPGIDLSQNENLRMRNTTLSDGTDLSMEGNLAWTHKLGQKAGRTLTMGIGGSKNRSDGESDSDNNPEAGESVRIHTNTVSEEDGYTLSTRLSYTEPVSAHSRLMATYRLSYTESRSDVKARDLLSDDPVNNLDTARSNIYSQNYITHTGELGYSYNDGPLRLTAQMAYRMSERERNQEFPEIEAPDYTRSFVSWQPSLNARYSIERSRYFDFRYTGRASLPSLANLQDVIRESSNGTVLTIGNPELKQSYSHAFTLRYNASNAEKSTNFWAMADAQLTNNNVSNIVEFFDRDTVLIQYNNHNVQAGSQLRRPVNMDGAIGLNSMSGYSFSIRPLRVNVNLMGGYSYNRTPSYTVDRNLKENLLNYANTHGMNFRVGFVSNISQNVDFDLSSFTRLSYTANSQQIMENNRTWNENVTGRLNVIFLGGFTGNTDFSWRYQTTSGQRGTSTNSYIWNAGLGYKFLRRKTAEFRVTFYDLLNQSQKAPRESAQDLYMNTSWSRSMGRYVLATFSFRFNSMNRLGNAGRGDSENERRMGPGGYGRPDGMVPGSRMGTGGGMGGHGGRY